ncbi:MAG: NCS2 family permease [Phascolarctobacterium sp.]
MSFLENLFKLKENKTTVQNEVIAGFTTFVTMAYILAVNPSILSVSGMDVGAVFTATAVSAVIGTLLMAGLSNYPFALAPGMGPNAFLAYTVCGAMGYSWQIALTAVFIEGIIFVLLSVTKIREMLFDSIPMSLKIGITAGIGLFIAFIGMQNAKIIVAGPGLVSLFSFKASLANGTFASQGIGACLACVGVLVTAVLIAKKVPGGLLLGILLTWIAGIVCEFAGFYIPDPKLGAYSLLPDFSNGLAVPSLAPTLLQMDFSAVATFDFITIMLSFMFVDFFDTLGTLIGVGAKAKMLDEEGRLPRIKGVLLADSTATAIGALLGTSTVTTFAESSAGVAAGGRTGLTGVVVAMLFFSSLFFSPIFLAIPAFATAPALIVVGYMMFGTIATLDFDDYADSFPAFLAAVAMPFMYSISDGIAFGVISYVVMKLATGTLLKKQADYIVCVLALIFILKYIYM